jgi:hypothetical protein
MRKRDVERCLKGRLTWDNCTLSVRAEFLKKMRCKQYNDDHMCMAWTWFFDGWVACEYPNFEYFK